jgi:lambda family phage portal protein
MQEFDPSKPTIGFGEFTKENKRWVSSGVQVSYNALANDLEGVNYSSMRSGLLIERDSWQCLQQMWIDRFRFPVHGWFVPAAILSGNLRLPSRDASLYLAARFVPRGWKWVDPLKDVTAAVLAIKEGLGSRTSYLGEQGDDFETIAEQLGDEADIAELAGITLGEDAPQNDQQTRDQRLMAALRLLLAEEKEA